MEPKSSLLCLQERASGPYPKPDISSPAYFFNINFSIILPYIPRCSSHLFLAGFSTKIPFAFLFCPMHTTYPAHLLVLNLMTLIICGKELKKNMKFFIRQFSPASMLLPSSQTQMSCSAHHSWTPSVYRLPLTCKNKFYTHTKQQARSVLHVLT